MRRRPTPAWRLALLVAALAPAAHAESGAPAIHVDDGDFTLDAYNPASDQPSVGGRANLDLRLDNLETKLQANIESGGLEVGPDPLGASAWGQSWTGGQAQLTAIWSPSGTARLEVSLSNQLKRQLSQLNPLAPGVSGQLTSTQTGSAKVAAILTPVTPLELQFGGETTSGGVDTLVYAPAGGSPTASNLRSDTARVFADLTWRPVARFSLEAGDAVETLGVAVTGTSAAYAYPTPHVVGTLTPWADGEWKIGAERAVTAPNAAQFATFASVLATAVRSEPASFQPDRAWRYTASVRQTLPGAIVVSASLIQSNLESVTDLGPVGGGQAPVSIGAGQRREVQVAFSTPVALPYAPGAKLSATAGWRQSQVTDPFTGLRRPISGDAPYQAEIDLTGVLGSLPVNWGVKAQLSGPQSIYQMSEVDTLSPSAGLGGVINYRAGPVTVGFQVDNLVGGLRTNTSLYYSGSRASDVIDGVRQTHDDSRAFRLSFTRAL